MSQGRGVSVPEVNTLCDIVKQSRTTAGEMFPCTWEHPTQESVKSFILSLWLYKHGHSLQFIIQIIKEDLGVLYCLALMMFTSKCMEHAKAFQKRMELSLILSLCNSELFLQFHGKRRMELNTIWGKKVEALLLWWYFISRSAPKTPTRSDGRSRPVLDRDMLSES